MAFNNLCEALNCLVLSVKNTMSLFSVSTVFILSKLSITPELTSGELWIWMHHILAQLLNLYLCKTVSSEGLESCLAL